MSQNISVAIQTAGGGVLTLGQGDAELMRTRTSVADQVNTRDADTSAAASDEALVARVCAGEREAFEVLAARYQDRLYTIIHGYVRDPEDALDLVQETLVKAYRGLGGFRGGSSFYTWLYRIGINNCKDYLRKRAARPAVSLEDAQLQDVGFEPAAVDRESDPAGTAEAKELRAAVCDAVEKLPEKLRMAVILHDIQGLPQQEVAAILKCPLGTAKSHVFRGRAQLRKLLGRYVEGEE